MNAAENGCPVWGALLNAAENGCAVWGDLEDAAVVDDWDGSEMKGELLSPRYRTNWDELLAATA